MKPSQLVPAFFLVFLLVFVGTFVDLAYAAPIDDLAARDTFAKLPPWEESSLSPRSIVKRGCMQSKQSGPQYVCNGDVPSENELRQQIQNHGNVGTKTSVFYTNLKGASALNQITCWFNKYPNQNPTNGIVAFNKIVDPAYEQAVGQAMVQAGNQDKIGRYQKLISQIFAEESSGDAFIFAPSGIDLTTLGDRNTWQNWEYPALTRNSNINRILRVDPTQTTNVNPTISTIWLKGDPVSPQEPLGTNWPQGI
ncbi:MAG: hypothetical protein M1822_009004 [Bathelium mastoideum]|nr:MAG: hypothetical protein M1822_009004 [Bathelium mastoideum]